MATPVVFVADEAFAVGLAAALQSVVQHTQPLPPLFVLDAGLSQESRRKLEQVAPLQWVDVSHSSPAVQDIARLLPAASSSAAPPPLACWLKLFLAELLPAGLDRALYLDCDVLALTSLQPLLETDLQGHMLAAVRDVGLPCGPSQLRAAGWPAGRPYFNAGVLLLDLKRLRQAAPVIRRLLAEHGASLPYHDQDVLNLLVWEDSQAGGLTAVGSPSSSTAAASRAGATAGPAGSSAANGWLDLGLRWNAQGVGSYAGFRLKGEEDGSPALFASEAELRSFEERLAVVHFTGPATVAPSAYLNPWVPFNSKPWAYLCRHPFRPAFYRSLDATPWRDWRPDQAQVAQACAQEVQAFLSRVAAADPSFDPARCLLRLIGALAAQVVRLVWRRALGLWWPVIV